MELASKLHRIFLKLLSQVHRLIFTTILQVHSHDSHDDLCSYNSANGYSSAIVGITACNLNGIDKFKIGDDKIISAS